MTRVCESSNARKVEALFLVGARARDALHDEYWCFKPQPKHPIEILRAAGGAAPASSHTCSTRRRRRYPPNAVARGSPAAAGAEHANLLRRTSSVSVECKRLALSYGKHCLLAVQMTGKGSIR